MNKKFIPLILLSTALLMTGCAKKEKTKSNSGETPTSGQPGQTSDTPASGTVIEFAKADFPVVSGAAYEATKNGVKVAISQGAINANYDEFRIYKNATMTISGATFTKIEISFTSHYDKDGDKYKYYDGRNVAPVDGMTVASDYLSATWNGNATSFVLTASVAQTRPTKVAITIA